MQAGWSLGWTKSEGRPFVLYVCEACGTVTDFFCPLKSAPDPQCCSSAISYPSSSEFQEHLQKRQRMTPERDAILHGMDRKSPMFNRGDYGIDIVKTKSGKTFGTALHNLATNLLGPKWGWKRSPGWSTK